MERRLITTEFTEEDQKIENSLRPQSLEEYIGQQKARETLKVYIEAAKARGESLDHVLLYGPPGLGKTTLAGIIANEMGVNLKITSGPAIEKPGEMAAILNNLQEGDVLFVDEIHRLTRQVEEVLYPAMEDYAIDIVIGKGASARSIRLELPHFTMVGATTRAGMLTAPLRDRFGVMHRLEFYSPEELQTIVPVSYTHLASLKDSLSREQFRLYQLIWRRFAASRMQDARYENTTIKIKAGEHPFSASANIQTFDGFLSVYDGEEEKLEKHSLVQKLTKESELSLNEFDPKQHFTQPPAHFTEASLVRAMEECGIGRPSTYAPTITTLLARRYIRCV